MKRILTIFLFAVCVMITMLIVKIDDYQKVYNSSQGLNDTDINNKLENLTTEEIDALLELINARENVTNDDDTMNDIINEFKEKLELSFNDIDKQIMIKYKNSNFLPWYNVIYEERDMSYKLEDNSNTVEWIEVDDKQVVFGKELNNFDDIKDFFGSDSINIAKVKNVDFNYDYYELTYNYDDINIKFMSYYEDGSNNICIVS